VAREGADLSPDALRAHLAARLAKYKIPTDIHLVPALPKTTVGKIDKKRLRLANAGDA
jgi:non-ribosomal peptide synthetase component E (peptide arylation enzyme)